ncbi:MFS transporter [Spirosoma pollinicola]|uniref:MFS transporter n=1 Tax=Spirosoma pollinicola TaxID=2057025 RepID=A0A2K8Z3X3_9BACT|nr:MFS transporter [Spirosoma pollinicola]AUD04573.1 MFS transporter [Spirosoma pollinicola]
MNTIQLPVNQVKSVKLPWVGFALCLVAYLFGGTASTLMATYLPVALPQLLDGSTSAEEIGEVGAWVSAAFLYGWMTGGLLFGPLADRLGRVRALALATGLCGGAMLATVFVPNEYVLFLLRALTGAGVGGILLISTVYLSEVWPVNSRPIALGVLATAFPVGIVATGGLMSGFSDWRLAFCIGILPLTVAFLVWIFLPESILWQQGRSELSTSKPNLFSVENKPNLISGAIIFGSVLIGLWGIFSWIPTWVQSLLPAGQTGQTERGITMMLLGMGGILGGVASGFLVARLGPRPTLLLTFLGCILACGLLFLTNHVFSPVVYGEVALLSLFFGISQGSLSSYVPTLFSPSIRATATGFCFNIGRLFTATAVLFVGSLTSTLGGIGNALVVFSAAFLIAFGAIWIRK